MSKCIDRLSKIGIVPVVTIKDKNDAISLAQALIEGGIDTAEITFRSDFAEESISLIHKQFPNMLLGAGTVSSLQQAKSAINAGASFIVTPGFNHEVVNWCVEHNITVLPGIASASELEIALKYGINCVKFFPAESSGGAKKIKDLSAPYSHVKFLPTGGINSNNMHEYLSIPSVLAIGGSFMLPDKLIESKDWESIKNLAKTTIKHMLGYELSHIGIHCNSSQEAKQMADMLCNLFHFTYYSKPKSHFAGKHFEFITTYEQEGMNHIGIYTPYPERALYHLAKLGVYGIEETITRNKKTNLINFIYLDKEIAGFRIHLINPDIKMEV